MSQRPDLGFYDEGRDLASPDFYVDVFRTPGLARSLPPAIYRSLQYSMLEDAAVWTRDWVCVGSHADVPELGDLLPFTVGTHGLHVQRTADGLAARFNKAQHGGCRMVPLQCQGGTKTKCSFTSCGYSRDRAAIPAGELGDGTPEMHQYLGLRPERLLRAHVASWGPLIFVSLANAPKPLDAVFGALGPASGAFANKTSRLVDRWLEYDANWKLLGEALARGAIIDGEAERDWLMAETNLAHGAPAITYWLFPNVVLLVTAAETCVAILQPTAIGRTLCRLSVWGEPARGALYDWIDETAYRAAFAEAKHTTMVRWGTQHAPHTIGEPLPLQTDLHGHWSQRALAHRVLTLPSAAVDVPLYSNQRSF